MIKIEGYQTRDIINKIYDQDKNLGVLPLKKLSPQYVGREAELRSWSYVLVGKTKVYDKYDVWKWLEIRLRSKLQSILEGSNGKPGQSRFVNDAYDFQCPECNGFAVPKWPKDVEEAIRWLESDFDYLTWLCEYGHSNNL